MWHLALAAALAAPPPEVLDDLDRWHAGADRLIDGPRGCWMLEGEATQTLKLHQAADRFSLPSDHVTESSLSFVARLEDGVWKRLQVQRPEGEEEDLTLNLVPLIGRLGEELTLTDGRTGRSTVIHNNPDQGSMEVTASTGGVSLDQAVGFVGLLRRAVERWTGAAETREARWDADTEAVHYLRHASVREGSNETVEVRSVFPGGQDLATRIEAIWPKRMKVGSWPFRVTLRDPQMHVLGFVHNDQVLPNAESVSLVVGVVGFTLQYAQDIRYVAAAPCPEAPAE